MNKLSYVEYLSDKMNKQAGISPGILYGGAGALLGAGVGAIGGALHPDGLHSKIMGPYGNIAHGAFGGMALGLGMGAARNNIGWPMLALMGAVGGGMVDKLYSGGDNGMLSMGLGALATPALFYGGDAIRRKFFGKIPTPSPNLEWVRSMEARSNLSPERLDVLKDSMNRINAIKQDLERLKG